MVDQSSSARCHALFESALQTYEKKTGIKLAEHPLVLQLQSCRSIDDISTLLQNQAQAVNNSQSSDRIMKSIKQTLSILNPLSEATSLADDADLVSQQTPVAGFRSLTALFRRHLSRLQQYRLVSLSYSMYLLPPSSYVDILMTSRESGSQGRDIQPRRTR
jgi:hypothetical protein